MTIGEVRVSARGRAVEAEVWGQVEELTKRTASNGKPFWELKVRDGGDALALKAWSETPNFDQCDDLAVGDAVGVRGDFAVGAFGLDARHWAVRLLGEDEAGELFAGDSAGIAAREADVAFLRGVVESLADPRLRALGGLFLVEHGGRFARAAAARQNHHAERGGLVRHTAQMMRAAEALCGVYPGLHRDLLCAGVLFHDAGKLWETCPPERGFDLPRFKAGELLGHIAMGVELVNALWRKLPLADWASVQPPSEDVRLHLLHLVAAHHGALEFGSPVEPKTPEAVALHYIDNLDARIEMFDAAYAKNPEVGVGIFDRVRALGVFPVKPLERYPSDKPGGGE